MFLVNATRPHFYNGVTNRGGVILRTGLSNKPMQKDTYMKRIALAAALAGAVAKGLLAGGVLPVLKHIPGHGRATADSHMKLPVVETDRATLERTDFAPFRALSDLPLGMTAHVVFSAIDPVAPATTSAIMVGEVIRLAERRLGVEPLGVLLEAVEDERLPDEPVGDELAHVAHRRGVAEREAQLRLQPLLPRQRRGPSRVVEVVGDAVDQLRRLLRRQHAAMARCAVDHGRKRGDEVARIDHDHVGRQRAEMPALGDEAVTHAAEVGVRERARERRLVRAVARGVNGEIDADEAARADLRLRRWAVRGRRGGLGGVELRRHEA